MKLSNVFDQLVYGEFSKIHLGESGTLDRSHWNRIIAHINLGLTELYKRFDLKQVEMPVTVVAGTINYSLTTNEDFIELLHVFNSDNVEIPVNNRVTSPNSSWSECLASVDRVYTSTPDVLSVSSQMKPQVLTVVYKAGHIPIAKIPDADLVTYDPNTIDIDLPMHYLEALLYFVASRIFNPLDIGSVANRAPFHSGNNYYSKYEAACALLVQRGLDVNENYETHLFNQRGFV